MRLKIESLNIANDPGISLHVLITITNNSSQPIAITDAYLDSVPVYRQEHRFLFSKDNDLLKINTSRFPINLNSHETADLLFEFVDNSLTNTIGLSHLILKTSKSDFEKNINLSALEIPIEQLEKLISAKHK